MLKTLKLVYDYRQQHFFKYFFSLLLPVIVYYIHSLALSR